MCLSGSETYPLLTLQIGTKPGIVKCTINMATLKAAFTGTGSQLALLGQTHPMVIDACGGVVSKEPKSIFGGPAPALWDFGQGSWDSCSLASLSSMYLSTRMSNLVLLSDPGPLLLPAETGHLPIYYSQVCNS